MPDNLTTPGVFIEEIPRGVRKIEGVATSITAFLGRASRGPECEPVTIVSAGDFEQIFGAQDSNYPMSYAVRDFFLNGGSTAIIVRLLSGAQSARVELGGLPLEASSPGVWGNQLYGIIDSEGIDAEVAAPFAPLGSDDLFNLTIVEKDDNRVVEIEKYDRISVKDGRCGVDRIVNQQSLLARINISSLGDTLARPADTTETAFTGGTAGRALSVLDYIGSDVQNTGLYVLDKTELFNLLCIPPDIFGGDTDTAVYQQAMAYCARRRAMLIVDSPSGWGRPRETATTNAVAGLPILGLTGDTARNAALYFPRVIQADPLREGECAEFANCGIVAGLMARTDSARGVWKAPAGIDVSLIGAQGLQVNVSDVENAILNGIGINCLRSFPTYGIVSWGARTLAGADELSDEYKYVSVRRFALFLEESLSRGLQFAVFEPNDERLWAQVRLMIRTFMQQLFRQGAFRGQSAADAYLVKADAETTTQNDINRGVFNIIVGFAPLKPAEFVIIKLQQAAGQLNT